MKEVAQSFQRHSQGNTRLTLNKDIWIFKQEITRYSDVILLVDDLDEYSEDDKVRTEPVEALPIILAEALNTETTGKDMVTSRLADSPFLGATTVRTQAADGDVAELVSSRIDGGLCLSRSLSAKVREDNVLKKDILTRIVQKAVGS